MEAGSRKQCFMHGQLQGAGKLCRVFYRERGHYAGFFAGFYAEAGNVQHSAPSTSSHGTAGSSSHHCVTDNIKLQTGQCSETLKQNLLDHGTSAVWK